ncbi:type II secretion system protein GspD [Burkholderia sp. LMG 13014]|uniref:type II secretion system protein GspD n=1 Tax=Burkholderia sp. LMG 13014 TaxID=2709306 RepID=UPI001F067C42|nr:type II secretory pathway protein [Burkholderia sp. LMG 13014]
MNKITRFVVVASVAWSVQARAIGVADLPPLPSALPVASGVQTVPLAPLPRQKNGAFDLRFVNVGQVVDLVYGDALKVPHVISSDVLQDQRLVSFQFDSTKGDLHAFIKTFLDSLGFEVVNRDGVDFVGKRADAGVGEVPRAMLVYRPRFRSAEYLSSLVRPLFGNRLSQGAGVLQRIAPQSAGVVQRAPGQQQGVLQRMPDGEGLGVGSVGAGVVQRTSADAYSSWAGADQPLSVASADELVFLGAARDIGDLKRLLPQLDYPAGEVVVRGWVYEVSNTDQHNTAFSIAAKLLNGTLSAANGVTDSDPTRIRFDAGFLSVAISALNADTRFRQVSDPHVRVVSGQSVRLNVGSQVPTLGSISYQGPSGTPVQSVQYQDAGLIFDVQPTVMADSIQVKLNEEMSSFVATSTGVNNSPTKNTRQMVTTVNLKDGEVVVLGGLVQDTDTRSTNSPGWLPKFLDGHSASTGRTEVLLVLQVSKVADL